MICTVGMKGMVLLGLVLLSTSIMVLADQVTPQKPKDWDKRLEMLRSVPYLTLSEETVDQGNTGVVFHNPEMAYEGYNLYCDRLSGETLLLNMAGHTEHRWEGLPDWGKGYYQHAVLLESGDLLVIVENRSLLLLDRDSKLIWKKTLGAHHDVACAPDGSFLAIVRHLEQYRGLKVWFDAIVHLKENGEEIYRWSTCEHLDELKNMLDTRWFLDTILDSIWAGRSPQGKISDEVKKAINRSRSHKVDYFHLNTLNLLPANELGERDSRFQEGNLLVCFRNINQIAVLERGTYHVLWAWGEGQLEWPHHPTMLENGHILIFDNGVQRKYSRVVELDPITETIVWEFVAEVRENFFTSGGGAAQRLPNGNTLICETNDGCVFEVTEQGEVVWMWLNPITDEDCRIAGSEAKTLEGKNRPVTVYRMARLSQERVDRWLKGQWW